MIELIDIWGGGGGIKIIILLQLYGTQIMEMTAIPSSKSYPTTKFRE